VSQAPTEPRKIKNFKSAHEIVALLEARGCSDAEIAEATGYSNNYIWRIRNELPEYALALSDFKREIQERVIDDTADAITKFNSKVPVMIDNLENLALRANKEGVQLKATTDWLDRAPDAPKRVSREEHSEERKIVFSIQQSENMKDALVDIGADEVVELLEGEGFEVEQQNVISADDD
jgi:transcriptional regulator with XRE-family HTH domain